jgi:phage terminase large subunit GpA-like protein
MPDEDSIDELFDEELKPLLKATPETRRLMSERAWDNTKHELHLSTMPILGLYSGSSSKLEKRKFRYAIGDEINLYKDQAGQPSALSRLLIRITTWAHRGRAIFGSKPTTTDGAVTKGYESCPDKRRFFMPCARCGMYHEWLWSQVKGFKDAPGNDKYERADYVKRNGQAHYECPNCHKVTEERERMGCVRAGRYVSGFMDGEQWKPLQKVTEDGVVVGDRPASERVGFYVWGIHSPWTPMSLLAAEFIEAEGDAEKTATFRTTRLALPVRQVIKSVRPSVVRDKKAFAPEPLIVPAWASHLFATVDTQDDWFKYTIRAWGGGLKSQLIAEGEVHESNAPVKAEERKRWAWDEVYRIGLESRFSIEGGAGIVSPSVMLIDSGGNRTNEVYEFSQRDPARIRATKGMSKSGVKLFYETTPKPGIVLWMVDTNHFKGVLYALMHDADQTKWMPHRETSEQYCLEMASESLVSVKGRWAWLPNGTARNEAWDCEVLQRAAAEMFEVGAAAPMISPPPAARTPISDMSPAGFVNSYKGTF